jgi:anthranilate/para-aminobenzoate synthase component I
MQKLNILKKTRFLLKSILAPYQTPKVGVLFPEGGSPIAGTTLPFAGGAVGYFAYDLARRLEKLPNQAKPAAGIPEMMVGVYDWAVVVDHREKCSHLISHGFNTETHQNGQGWKPYSIKLLKLS